MNEDSPRYEGWRVVAASALGIFLASLLAYTFAIFLKPLTEELGWSRGQVSTAYGIAAAMSALSAAPLGHLLDRLGPRPIVISCLVLFGLVFGSLAALTPHLWHLYAAFAVLGVVVTGTSPVAYARAVSSWFERRRGMALAIAISGASIGGLVHPPATQALMAMVGWRGACLILGGVVLVVGVPAAIRFVRARPSATRSAEDVAPGASVREGLRSRVFWILIPVLFCSSIVQSSAVVHLPALLTDRGATASAAALAMSVYGGANVLGRLVTGWMIDRFFAPYVSLALLLAVSLGSFVLSDASSLAAGMVAAVLIGFGTGGEADVAPYLLSRYFGLRVFSTLFGLTWMASALAAAAGPVLMGRAFDATGSYESVLVRLAIVTLGVAALLLAMPRYDRLPSPTGDRAGLNSL